ncbi:hypothetical protein BURMUCF2_A1093 [Burkholderia multivorans CF2]|nr:hypothetical protein BURMUCF2_A1093 [Burkholderia multivorans CF2]
MKNGFVSTPARHGTRDAHGNAPHAPVHNGKRRARTRRLDRARGRRRARPRE